MSGTEPDFAAIAEQVTGPWPQIVACWDAFRLKYGLRLRVDTGETDQHGFVTEALGAAYGKRRLGALSAALQERKLAGPGFAAAVAPLVDTGFALQTYVNGVFRVQYAAETQTGMQRAMETVCRISVDNAHKGTGVLIAPNLVATAAHVIAPLVNVGDPEPSGRRTSQAAEDSLGRLVVHFAHEEDEDTQPVVARLHQNWLVHYSEPAPLEGKGAAIDAVDDIDPGGPWDLAVIRLSVPPIAGSIGCTPRHGHVDPPSFGVQVLHHPADAFGAPMRMLRSIGEVRRALHDATQPLRWLHTANTSGGSSGAPCFDMNWNLVALHQAGPHRITDQPQLNRAVPIRAWVDDIRRWTATIAPTPFATFVDDEHGRRRPVIGRRDLQSALWRAMNGGDERKRAFIVRGGPGLGKAFTLSIVRHLAGIAGHGVAAIDVRNAQGDDAAAFAQRVVGALAAHLPRETLAPSRLTSTLRDIRNDIAPALLAEIAGITAGRQVWLVLNGFDGAALSTSSPVLQLIELMLAGLDGVPGLQLVLAGWDGPVGQHILDMLVEPTAADIVDHVLTTLMPGGEIPPKPLCDIVTGAVALMLASEPPGPAFERAIAVANRARSLAGGLA